jgi:hypothetical protein
MISNIFRHTENHSIIRIINKTFISYLFTGVGLSWATQNENYSHYPLCIICPSVYIGYQGFNNMDRIILKLKHYDII